MLRSADNDTPSEQILAVRENSNRLNREKDRADTGDGRREADGGLQNGGANRVD